MKQGKGAAILLLVTSLLALLTLASAGSSKKGLANSNYHYHCRDLDVINNIAWWYCITVLGASMSFTRNSAVYYCTTMLA